MRIAYFDCTSGISGDMTLGALIDAGASTQRIQAAICSMGLPALNLKTERVKKFGFAATALTVEHPPEHAHRHLHHINAMLDQGELAPAARKLAKEIFLNLGEAEAAVHGTTLEKVHFHEVGAIDSIADITGVAVAMTELGIERVECSAVPTGGGTIKIAHGTVGVPAPATALLLRGIPLAPSEIQAELTTPTGAAILKTTAKKFGAMPAMQVDSIGVGAGTMDLEEQANVLRVFIGEATIQQDARKVEHDQTVILQTNLDDCMGEDISYCCQLLRQAGARDVFQTSTIMKKGRCGVELTVLCSPEVVSQMENLIFEHSSAIGIRRSEMQRTVLIREPMTVETAFGPVQGKCVWLPTQRWRFTPEYDCVAELASTIGASIEQIRQAAAAAFDTKRLSPPS